MRNERDEVTREDELPPQRPKREGDILGLSDADPHVDIPQATDDHGGNPRGIEVRDHATGIGDLTRSKGATGMDMGAGGEDTELASDFEGPRSSKDRND